MSQPASLLPERPAAEQAIRELESGQAAAALELLRRVLSRRKPPTAGPDRRSNDVVRMRAFIEQAIVELEHGDADFALRTLRRALAIPAGQP